MLDVHPPHAPTHTWKDFFIHIATIVIGLLIAVGLEQTVEAIHRHRERTELVRDMREEAERNLQVLEGDQNINLVKQRWAQGVLTALQGAALSGPALTVQLPTRSRVASDHSPDREVWPVAKANGKAAFVEEQAAEIYDRCDIDASQEFSSYYDSALAEAETSAAQTRYSLHLESGATVHLALAARDELARVFAHYLSTLEVYIFWTSAWHGCSDAIAHNARSRTEVDSYVEKSFAAPGQ